MKLLVETVFTQFRGARLVAEQRVSRDGETLWQAHVLAAVVDLQGRPKRMPKEVAALLTPHLGASFQPSHKFARTGHQPLGDRQNKYALPC